MRTIVALIVIVLSVLPALYAGWPGLAPGWFDSDWRGVPMTVVGNCDLMAGFVLLGALCSAAAKAKSGGR